MDKNIMLKALKRLDSELKSKATMLIGGGAALLLAHNIPLSTMDIDGLLIESEITPAELDPLVKGVARELKINPHWFTTYFGTFTYTIPSDYKNRIVTVYNGRHLKVVAFGLEELLIMKCFSGREKDIGHARAIARKDTDLDFVEDYIRRLKEKGVPGGDKALNFLHEIRDQVGK